MTTSDHELCIALSTINELKNLQTLIPALLLQFRSVDILVIDDASSDGTQDYLNQLAISNSRVKSIYRPTRLGIGSAHMAAMNYANECGYKFLITMDADLTHRPSDVTQLLNEIKNYDFVIGSRYLGKKNIIGWSNFRLFLAHGAHLVTKIFFLTTLDMSSGLRAYKVNKIPLKSLILNCPVNYEFFFISTLIFLRSDCNIGQVRVQLLNRKSGKSKMTLRLMLNGILQLLLYGLRIKKIKI
jgi:dolichol-phosphate mannosyltransferase